MKLLWRVIAWVAVICSLLAYFVGWTALIVKSVIWGIPTEFWFYDSVASGIIGIFFLMLSVHSKK